MDLLFPSDIISREHLIQSGDIPTATYISVNVRGNVWFGFSAIEEAVAAVTPERIEQNARLFAESDYILADGNLSASALRKTAELAEIFGKKVWFDPADLEKVQKMFEANCVDRITGFSPNANEFRNYCRLLGISVNDEDLTDSEHLADFLNSSVSRLGRLFPDSMEFLLVTLGNKGVVLGSREPSGRVEIWSVPAPEVGNLKSVSGAGDCFNSAFLSAHLFGIRSPSDCLRCGRLGAELALQTFDAVPKTLSFDSVIRPFLRSERLVEMIQN